MTRRSCWRRLQVEICRHKLRFGDSPDVQARLATFNWRRHALFNWSVPVVGTTSMSSLGSM